MDEGMGGWQEEKWQREQRRKKPQPGRGGMGGQGLEGRGKKKVGEAIESVTEGWQEEYKEIEMGSRRRKGGREGKE